MQAENLTVIHGCMFSRKSKELVEAYGDGVGVMAFKPAIDAKRYGGGSRITSKDPQYHAPAILIDEKHPEVILDYIEKFEGISKILVDECNFYPPVKFVDLVSVLTDSGLIVVLAGLTHFATQEPWGPLNGLLRVEGIHTIHLKADCDGENRSCKTPAIWTYQKYPHDKVLVDSDGAYGATCDLHYSTLHKGEIYR